jgi:xanthine dehydrogenase accessory factor
VALSILGQIIEMRQAPGHVRSLPIVDVAPRAEATAIDPICHMTVAAIESSIHADVDGTRWYFCCPGCRTTFLADPAKYVEA